MASEDKKVVIVVSADDQRRNRIEAEVVNRVSGVTIYSAADGITAMKKIENVPPHVFIMDWDLPKLGGSKLIRKIIEDKAHASMAIVVAGALPLEALHVDELVTGQLQFVGDDLSAASLTHCIFHALNYSFHSRQAEYYMKFLSDGERLITEGDHAESVYIVTKGRLKAFKESGEKKQLLGHVEAGEFVGEMAYINGEPRIASVDAITDCELIEIPIGTLDKVLYKRPAWTKKLMHTLSKRLKAANDKN